MYSADDATDIIAQRLTLTFPLDNDTSASLAGTSGLRDLGIPPFVVCDHSHRKHDDAGPEPTAAPSQPEGTPDDGEETKGKGKGKGKKHSNPG